MRSIESELKRKMSKMGSTLEQVNDFCLMPFHVMTHTNVLVTHCCSLTAIKINREREDPKRERDRKKE